jgi:hypothetical protein
LEKHRLEGGKDAKGNESKAKGMGIRYAWIGMGTSPSFCRERQTANLCTRRANYFAQGETGFREAKEEVIAV